MTWRLATQQDDLLGSTVGYCQGGVAADSLIKIGASSKCCQNCPAPDCTSKTGHGARSALRSDFCDLPGSSSAALAIRDWARFGEVVDDFGRDLRVGTG
jgi:hypothetical protein